MAARVFASSAIPPTTALVNWDYTHVDQTADATPGLFESWTIDPGNPTRWIFTLRQGVLFHDGSPLTMDDIVWNLQRVWDDKSPQYDAPAAPIVRATVTMLDRWEKIDDGKIAIYTKTPFSFFHYLLTVLSDRQPAAMGKDGAQLDRLRQSTGRHRAVQDHPRRAGPVCRDDPQRDLLEQGAHSEAGTDDRLSDAGSDDAPRRAALRPGGLDRGAAAGCDPFAARRGLPDQPVAVSAHVSLCAELRGRHGVQRRSCAPGDELRDRPRRAVRHAEWHRQSRRTGFYPPEHPLFGKPKMRYGHDPERAKRSAAAGRIRTEQACRRRRS